MRLLCKRPTLFGCQARIVTSRPRINTCIIRFNTRTVDRPLGITARDWRVQLHVLCESLSSKRTDAAASGGRSTVKRLHHHAHSRYVRGKHVVVSDVDVQFNEAA